jgi:formylglycine-generating enzyme required for sulfatase activity
MVIGLSLRKDDGCKRSVVPILPSEGHFMPQAIHHAGFSALLGATLLFVTQASNAQPSEQPRSCCAATGRAALLLASNPPAAASGKNAGPPGMVWIEGGEFKMGSTDPLARPDESPVHRVRVDGFWIDEAEVTNAQFAQFVKATNYKTVAERAVDWEELKKQLPAGTPKPDEKMLLPGSLVFTPPDHPVDLRAYDQWWACNTRTVRPARSRARTTIQSSTSRTKMPSPTQSGPASNCRPKPNGSLPPVVAWTTR